MENTKKIKSTAKITSYILAFAALLAVMMFAEITSFAATSGDYEYTVLSDSTAEITGYSGNATSITIPSKLDGYTVTSIGEGAFSWCESLTSVTIVNSVMSIGEDAFWGCESLKSITIPNSVTSIGDGAFGVCTSLNSITIPSSVTSIGENAFYSCTNLKSITIPNSVKNIARSTFDSSGLASIIIPNSVTSIGREAFNGCTSLKSITIPSSVTSIDWYAFFECTSLTSITIPNSVTSIGEGVFRDCTSLTSLNVDASNKKYSSKDGVLFDKNKTELIQYPIGNKRTSYTVPSGVTSIGDYAFEDCSSLSSITLPNTVKSIGQSAFEGCKDLTSVTIPNGVTSIAAWSFSDCTSLKSIIIPNNVTSIGYSAFRGCESLKSIIIPNNVTSIGYSAFRGCESLKSITIPNSVTFIDIWAFRDCKSLADIYYTGSSAQWNKITISDPFEKVTIHYNYGAQLATPKLSSVSNVVAGVKVTWGKVSGAEKYRVFYKTGSGSWTKAGDTTSTSYTWTGAKNNTKYSFTVRCMDEDGNYTSSYDSTGKSITFMSAPTVSVSNVVAGVKISWGKVSGAANYAIFRKTPDGSYKKIGTATGTSYTDKTAKNNTKYVYAVRCATKDGKTYTSSYNAGKSITFLSAPTVSVSNVVAGVKVSWGKVSGAVNYKVYRKTPNGSYKALGTTTSTSFVDKTAKNNTKYIYAVRCVTKDGKTTTSSYNAGKSKTFMSAPNFSVSNVVAGVKISWNKVSGASNYAVFRKTANGSYKKIGTTTGTSFVDKTAKSGTKYIYTVRCASKDGKTYTSSYNAGKSKTFVSAPTFTVSKTSTGVQVKWSKVTGASNYAIFRKTANGSYKKIGTTTGTSFVDKTAKKGTKYIYTVRCVSKDGKSYTSSYNAGKSITR